MHRILKQFPPYVVHYNALGELFEETIPLYFFPNYEHASFPVFAHDITLFINSKQFKMPCMFMSSALVMYYKRRFM